MADWYEKDGKRYPPQKLPQGYGDALAVMREGCVCEHKNQACERCLDKAVRFLYAQKGFRGPHLCDCEHVEDGTNHRHTHMRCPACGGWCTGERWTPQAVAAAKYMLTLEIGHMMHRIALETKEVVVARLGEHQRKEIEAAFSHFGRRRIDYTISVREEPSRALNPVMEQARLSVGEIPAIGASGGD